MQKQRSTLEEAPLPTVVVVKREKDFVKSEHAAASKLLY